eukprot:COSAG01_NODE_60579_length_294_cov_0.574359_1_plen_70_part_10
MLTRARARRQTDTHTERHRLSLGYVDMRVSHAAACVCQGGRHAAGSGFFKQKTAYEIMSGDWSSDVCSSD